MSTSDRHPQLDNLDPELEQLLANSGPALDFEDQQQARRLSAARAALRHRSRIDSQSILVTDHVVIGRAGQRVRVRSYRRSDVAGCPAGIVHFHGGAFIVGDLETEDSDCRNTSAQTGCVVLSVDYRLAPEHPFPAATEDGFDVLCWAHAHASELRIDPSRLAVSGTSAGGCIAASVAMRARDTGGPALRLQQLVYPVLDDMMKTPSSHWKLTPVLTHSQVEIMWRKYLGDGAGADEVSPYAAPARQKDLAGLPDTYIVVAGLDPLRDEALEFAIRLIDAGVSVELHHYPSAVHGFDKLGDSTLGERSVSDRNAALVAELTRPVSQSLGKVAANG
jgi:acetyl esterase/lipase